LIFRIERRVSRIFERPIAAPVAIALPIDLASPPRAAEIPPNTDPNAIEPVMFLTHAFVMCPLTSFVLASLSAAPTNFSHCAWAEGSLANSALILVVLSLYQFTRARLQI